jgi:hypothetical protein
MTPRRHPGPAPRGDYGVLPRVSPQQARDAQLFGPVYHGTSRIEDIRQHGFRFERGGLPGQGETTNGLVGDGEYALGYYPPVHWLGYGVYFTTSKTTAQRYAQGRGGQQLGPYWLDVPRLLTINWGAPRTMMQWWLSVGFDGPLANHGPRGRVAATEAMTDYLAARYDGVWFKGQGLHRLLDGDQICVYDPARIYVEDRDLAGAFEIGAKVLANDPDWGENGHWEYPAGGDRYYVGHQRYVSVPPGTRGTVRDRRPVHEGMTWAGDAPYVLVVKWEPRGNDNNVPSNRVLPAPTRGRR